MSDEPLVPVDITTKLHNHASLIENGYYIRAGAEVMREAHAEIERLRKDAVTADNQIRILATALAEATLKSNALRLLVEEYCPHRLEGK